MNHKGMSYLSFIVLLVGLISLWGCPKKTEVTTTPAAQTQSEKGMPATSSKEAATADMKSEGPNEKSGMTADGLKPVYFDFDRSIIRDDAGAVMKTNAEWLKANPNAKITIEGNCDERGTKEYNQALGQRRAASAKKYLTDMGISTRRISLISYGKEKQICTEDSETCWQKNRRDDFATAGE